MKHLIKKFGFRGINKEIEKHNWILPSADEVRNAEIEYDVVWVNDIPELESDWETHACIYDVVNDKIEVCNKSFMMNIVVIKGIK